MSAEIREWHHIDAARFRAEILPLQQPAVLRAVAEHWPAVRAGHAGAAEMAAYLRAMDVGASAETMYGPPGIEGHFFYRDDLRSFNFERPRFDDWYIRHERFCRGRIRRTRIY